MSSVKRRTPGTNVPSANQSTSRPLLGENQTARPNQVLPKPPGTPGTTPATTTPGTTLTPAPGTSNPASPADAHDVGERPFSRFLSYTYLIPFGLVIIWYGYFMSLCWTVFSAPGFSPSTQISSIKKTMEDAKLAMTDVLFPYLEMIVLKMFITDNIWQFIGYNAVQMGGMVIGMMFILTQANAIMNQQVYSVLAWGNMSIRSCIRSTSTFAKGCTALFVSIMMSSIISVSYIYRISTRNNSSGFIISLSKPDASTIYSYLTNVYYSLYLPLLALLPLAILYLLALATIIVKLFGNRTPDFKSTYSSSCIGAVPAIIFTIILFLIIGFFFFLITAIVLISCVISTGLVNGSKETQSTPGESAVAGIGMEWAYSRFSLAMFFIYPLLVQVLQFLIEFCCPPKKEDCPPIHQLVEEAETGFKLKQQQMKEQSKSLTITAVGGGAKLEELKKRKLAMMKAKENAMLKMKKEKELLRKQGKLTPQKEAEMMAEEMKMQQELETEEKKLDTEMLLTEETAATQGEAIRPTAASPKEKNKEDMKIKRQASIDTKATAKTAATGKNKNVLVSAQKKDTPAPVSISPPVLLSTDRVSSPVPARTASPARASPPAKAVNAPKRPPPAKTSSPAAKGEQEGSKFVPGVRTKMTVPKFDSKPGSGPLRIPKDYAFANARLAK